MFQICFKNVYANLGTGCMPIILATQRTAKESEASLGNRIKSVSVCLSKHINSYKFEYIINLLFRLPHQFYMLSGMILSRSRTELRLWHPQPSLSAQGNLDKALFYLFALVSL